MIKEKRGSKMKIGLIYLTPAKTSGAGVFQQTFAKGLKQKKQKVYFE